MGARMEVHGLLEVPVQGMMNQLDFPLFRNISSEKGERKIGNHPAQESERWGEEPEKQARTHTMQARARAMHHIQGD